MSKKSFTNGIKFKLVGAILLACIGMYVIAIAGAGALYYNAIESRYEKLLESVCGVVSEAVDADSVNLWFEGKNTLGYVQTSNRLLKISKGTLDLDSIVIYRMQPDGMYTVFNAHSTGIRGDLGEVAAYDTQWIEHKDDFLAGRTVEKITVTGYRGNVIMYCLPMFDSNYNCAAYICCGVAVKTMQEELIDFIGKYGLAMMAVLLITFAICVFYVHKKMLRPVNVLDGAIKDALGVGDPEIMRKIASTEVKTGDDIENIYRSVVKLYADKVQLSSIMQEEQKNVILTFAAMIKQASMDSVGYSDNTVEYVSVILNAMRENEKYKDIITDEVYNKIMLAAPLHDIGKLVISDKILYKPGKLTDQEYAFLKERMQYGASVIRNLEEELPESEYLELARQMAESHHERWDGKGYPYGLKGEEIPLPVRVISVADVFDALVARRCYKEPLSVDEAYKVIMDGRGTNFDPDIVDVFAECKEQIREIYNKCEADKGE